MVIKCWCCCRRCGLKWFIIIYFNVEIFIDWDGMYFWYILNWFCDGDGVVLELDVVSYRVFFKEVEYYCFDKMVKVIWEVFNFIMEYVVKN